MNIVYLNGEYLQEDEAKISIFDRGFVFGDGVYEVVPILNGKLIDKEPFIERFTRSLRELDLAWPMDIDAYLAMFDALIAKNNITQGGVYTQVTRGVAPRDFAFPKDTPPTCMAFVFAKEIINAPMAASGVKVVSVNDIRWKRRDIKSIALLGQCMAKQEATQKGAYEGWMVENGFVTEGTASSAYIVKDGKIITRPLSNAILPGIRRKILLEFAKKYNVPVEQRAFSLAEALEADEAFMSSATTFVLPIIEIDGVQIGDGKPGEMTQKMRAMYVESAKLEAGML